MALFTEHFDRAQHWRNCDTDIRAYLGAVVIALGEALGSDLVGIYLHGSLVHGSYRRAKSDFDLIAVVEQPLDRNERRRVSLLLAGLSDRRPTLGDMELSVLTRAQAGRFVHPSPFEVHYSEAWKVRIQREEVDYSTTRTDVDLAGHLSVVLSRGERLAGEPIEDIFGPVPWNSYLSAVLDDFDWLVRDENIHETPYYAVLNCCRTIQILESGEGNVPSKEEGARWALVEFPPDFLPLIDRALRCYCSSDEVSAEDRRHGGWDWDSGELEAFRDYVAARAARSRRLHDNF